MKTITYVLQLSEGIKYKWSVIILSQIWKLTTKPHLETSSILLSHMAPVQCGMKGPEKGPKDVLDFSLCLCLLIAYVLEVNNL